MLRFAATIVLTVFAVGTNAVCTTDEYQGLLNTYARAQATVPEDGSITSGEELYNFIAESFSDAQKQLTCLSCMRTITIDLFNLQATGVCTSDPPGSECETASTNIMNAFVSCSQETTKNARVALSGALSVMLIAATLIL
jgi:hypothetical protein